MLPNKVPVYFRSVIYTHTNTWIIVHMRVVWTYKRINDDSKQWITFLFSNIFVGTNYLWLVVNIKNIAAIGIPFFLPFSKQLKCTRSTSSCSTFGRNVRRCLFLVVVYMNLNVHTRSQCWSYLLNLFTGYWRVFEMQVRVRIAIYNLSTRKSYLRKCKSLFIY